MYIKNLFLSSFLFVVLFFVSCSNADNSQKKEEFKPPVGIKPTSKETRYDTLMEEKFGIPGESQFPFGCPAVIEIPFPNTWKIIENQGTEKMEFSYFNKALLSINTCLANINHAGTHQNKPTIKKATHLKLSDNAMFCDEYLKTDSIIYKLDDMGPYHAYYAFGNYYALNGHEKPYSPTDNCVEYGNLVLVNKKTQEAQVLNLYMAKGRDNDISLRVFYIDNEKSIQIKEFDCDATSCRFNQHYVVKVKQDGKISAQKIK
jgi:hypothetical protein